MLLNRVIPLMRMLMNQASSKYIFALNRRRIVTSSPRYRKNLHPEEEIIKFSQSKIHPNKLGLQQSRVLRGTPEGERLIKRRSRILGVFFGIPVCLLAIYFLIFDEIEIHIEQEDKIEKVFPGYQQRRMAEDPRYKAKMLELKRELGKSKS